MGGTRHRPPSPIGVILAGGKGRRMEGDKASALLGGRPLASYPVAAMRAAGLEALVVAKPGSALPDLGCPVLHEPAQPYHPLCGIVAALRECEPRPLVLCACDMPFVEPALLAWLGALDAPLAIAGGEDRLHPLLGRYEATLLEALAEQLTRQAPLSETVAMLGARVVGVRELARFGDPARICLNVNTPAEMERAERLLTGRGEDAPPAPHSGDLAR